MRYETEGFGKSQGCETNILAKVTYSSLSMFDRSYSYNNLIASTVYYTT